MTDTTDTADIEKLRQLIDKSRSTVFFGGAGVSTESGIPDFRSKDGLYNMKYKYPPEQIISRSFFEANPLEFYRFYRDKITSCEAKPNITHIRLAELERDGRLAAVVTQNIDGLHQAAGSRNVFELHGSVLRNYCTKCGKFYGVDCINAAEGVPLCDCGGIIKPDVVLYEEQLDDRTVSGAIASISCAELLIIGGTSLSVYPAAGFVRCFNGNAIVMINRTPTPLDKECDLVFNTGLGEVFRQI